ncbi:ankyrin [Orientia tsutsugamushi]|uniref:ankyrin repeat domain-containing protein n=1 Tax=Orientia tsutsugamushi TaxID=784 RepID=UPI00061F2775|nr:ankyrin repeat domain-containing protein [Orientia tsutsugamushi]KJV74372.1 ankyrin repeat family protein [Orientia tsutsugamushi str. TA763]SPP23756.1 ankyrin [Orientia tsutsugamushi]
MLVYNFRSNKTKYRYALHRAIKDGDFEKVKHLINNDSTLINSKYKDGITALSVALKYKNLPIPKILLNNRADINAKNNSGHTALHMSIISDGGNYNSKNIADSVRILIQHGANNLSANDDINAIIKFLVKNGANTNVKDNVDQTPLHWTVHYFINNLDIVQLLLDHDADPNMQNVHDITPLHLVVDTIQVYYEFSEKYPAYSSDHIALLLKYNADVNIENNQGNTPLSDAVECKCVEPLAIMLKHNSTSINKKYDEGEILLHIVARYQRTDVIQLLIDYGADIDVKDKTA